MHPAASVVWLLLAASAASDDSQSLAYWLRNISSRISRSVLPRTNSSQTITVSLEFFVSQLLSVDTSGQRVSMSGTLNANWEDERLVWDPKEFGNISRVVWGSDRLWRPEVHLNNGAGAEQKLQLPQEVQLQSLTPNTTRVNVQWRRVFDFSCHFDMTDFPTDEHECDMQVVVNEYGSYSKLLTMQKLNSTFKAKSTFVYQNNSEWELLWFRTRMKDVPVEIYESQETQMRVFAAEFRIRRHSNYYVIVVVLPLLLLTALQLLTYLVPLESGEKIGCGVTVLLSFTMFAVLIDNLVPKSEQVPGIVAFITASMALSAASLSCSSVLLRMHHTSSNTRMPVCIATVVQALALVTCVRSRVNDGVVKPFSDDQSDTAAEQLPASDVINMWQVAAAAVERIAFGIHFILVAALCSTFGASFL